MKVLEFELVVPAYNESKNLPLIISRAVAACKESGLTSEQFKLVVVNNGSTDDSEDTLRDLQKTPLASYFRTVKVEKNQGYGFGVWSGLQATHAPIVGWSHADMQCDPNDAFQAFKRVQQGSEKTFVKGVRSGRNWKDVFVTRVFELCARWFLGLKISEINAQPKVFRRTLLEKLKSPPFQWSFDLYVIYTAAKERYSFSNIPVLFPPRIHGASKWASNFLSRYRTILAAIAYMRRLQQSEGRL